MANIAIVLNFLMTHIYASSTSYYADGYEHFLLQITPEFLETKFFDKI